MGLWGTDRRGDMGECVGAYDCSAPRTDPEIITSQKNHVSEIHGLALENLVMLQAARLILWASLLAMVCAGSEQGSYRCTCV